MRKMNQSVEERAWGFTSEEYVDALSLVYPRESAKEDTSKIFRDLDLNSSHSVGGEHFLFALLSLVSPECKRRILEITRWSEHELLRQQTTALNHPPPRDT
jgi:hypothetical protein